MPGLVIGGVEVQIPGIPVVNFLDDPRLKLRISSKPDGVRDGAPRSTSEWIRAIVWHTTKGIPGGPDLRPQVILPGLGPVKDNETRIAQFWSTSDKQAGAHLIIDHDGGVACCADLRLHQTFHCPGANAHAIGGEIYQGNQAELYVGQLEIAVLVTNFLTAHFGIQRQIPAPYKGKPTKRLSVKGQETFVGVFGHRDADNDRGRGDPGDAFMNLLAAKGYRRFDLDLAEDLIWWKKFQTSLGFSNPDGIPGPRTLQKLKDLGMSDGLVQHDIVAVV